jgi:hypothetical protein
MKKLNLLLILVLLAGITRVSAQADMQENVTMIKKNLTDSKAAMQKYEWIETTTVFVKGEQKSVKQKQCYYALDGKLTKVETGGSTAAKTPGGLRGKVAENKKADMSDYAKKAIEKVQTYLPPDPEKLQKIYNDGKVGIQILEPNKKFKLSFPDYNEAGDVLSISLSKTDQKLMALDVSTSVDDPKEKVAFNVTFSDLPDGTQFQGTTTLDAPAKDLKIVIVNSGFKNASGK